MSHSHWSRNDVEAGCKHLAAALAISEDRLLDFAVELVKLKFDRDALADLAGKQTAPAPTYIDPAEVDEALTVLLEGRTPLVKEPNALDLLDKDDWLHYSRGKFGARERIGVTGREVLCTVCGNLFSPSSLRIKRCDSCRPNKRRK